jgi:arabinan endo-1,5-alpha-L-arabinosidase
MRQVGWARVVLGLIALLAIGSARAQTGDVRNVHDPVAIKEGDTYYLFGTGNGIDIRRSKDLIEWERVGRVFEEIPAWTFEAVPGFQGHMWAPDISRVNGKYWLYYSVSTFKSKVSAIGLTINETLDPDASNYAWRDQGMVVASSRASDFNAIDPNLIADEAGNYYLAWGSFWTGLKMTRIDAATGKPAADLTAHPAAIIPLASRGPDNDREGPFDTNAIEAPFIVRHEDYYYHFVSFDLCCRGENSNYKLAVGRSPSVAGPYVDRDGREMNLGGGTLLLAGYGPLVHGPGHNAVLQDDGRDWLLHHMYDKTRRFRPRLQIRPLVWDEEGWPLVGGAIDAGTEGAGAPDPLTLIGAWTAWEDFGGSRTLTIREDGNAMLGESGYRWDVAGDRVVLKGFAADGGSAPADLNLFAGQRGDWLTGRMGNGAVLYAERAP